MTEDVKWAIRNLRNISRSQCEDYSMYVAALAMLAADKLEILSKELENVTKSRDKWKDTALKVQERLRTGYRMAIGDFYE